MYFTIMYTKELLVAQSDYKKSNIANAPKLRAHWFI